MAGTFESEDRIHPTHWNPEGGTASTRWTGRMELDGAFLIADTEQRSNGEIDFRGHGVFGWDSYHQLFTSHFFSSAHGFSWGTGTWDGERLVFDNQIRPQWRDFYSFSQDGFQYVLESSSDGGKTWDPYLTSVYHRV